MSISQSPAVWHWWKNEDEPPFSSWQNDWKHHWIWEYHSFRSGYGSIPINTIFRGMNIHLPAILMFTRGTRFWPIPILLFFKRNYVVWSLHSFTKLSHVTWPLKTGHDPRLRCGPRKMTGRIWWEQPWLPDVAQKTRWSPQTRMLTRMLMAQMSKHMDMQSRRTLFCNSLFEQSCTYFPCYQSAVWSGKCRVWSVECKVRSVECKVWSVECRV